MVFVWWLFGNFRKWKWLVNIFVRWKNDGKWLSYWEAASTFNLLRRCFLKATSWIWSNICQVPILWVVEKLVAFVVICRARRGKMCSNDSQRRNQVDSLMTCWRDAEDVKRSARITQVTTRMITFLVGDSYKPSFKPLIPGFFCQKQSYGELDLMICSRLRGDKAVLHMQLPNLRMQLAAAGQRRNES